jgi:hypothetical protein
MKICPQQNFSMSSDTERGQQRGAFAGAPERPAEEVCVFPATFTQRRFLMQQQQLDKASTAYSVLCSIRMTGRLDVDVPERSLNEIVR